MKTINVFGVDITVSAWEIRVALAMSVVGVVLAVVAILFG